MSNRVSIGVLVGLALTFGPVSSGTAQAIQLRDGAVLVGDVTDATSEGLSFRRLDNGGLLDLRWDDLSLNSANQIKRLKGLVIENEEEVTLEADVVVYTLPGAAREEVAGKIIEWTDTHALLKRKSGVLPIRRDTIKRRRKREVPVLDVYTKDEFYQLKLEEFAPDDDADKHIALAEIMRRVGMYDRAEQHLKKAQELGTSKQQTQLPHMLARVQTLKESAGERDLLSQIKIMRNRKNFARAQELIDQFEQEYPDSDLASDLEREKRRFSQAREEHLIDRLRQLWDRAVRQVAGDHVKERESTFRAAQDYAEDRMAQDVFERLAGIVEIDREEVEQLWQNRQKYRRGVALIYSYGIGSWLLGEDKVIAGTAAAGQQEGTEGPSSGEDRELERLVRRLRELNRKKGSRRRQGGAEDAEETDEDWWKAASRADRTTWLRAYFAEFGGQMEIVRAYAHTCGNCLGQGFLLSTGSTGKDVKRPCPVCHSTKYTRALRAR